REDANHPRLRVRVPSLKYQEAVVALSRIDGVLWIAPFVEPKMFNDESFPSIQANAATGSPIWDRDLIGSGQIVAVADSGLDRNESWFTALDKGAGVVTEITDAESPLLPLVGNTFPNRKVFGYFVQPGATAYDGGVFHGTHVVGSVAGDRGQTSSPTDPAHDVSGDDGMAPNAQILFQDIGLEGAGAGLRINDLGGTLRQAVTAGARIHSNSWGSASAGAYGGNDIDADSTAWELENLLIAVAAGNDGVPIVGSTGTPGNGKNVLTVGAMGHGNSTAFASFSNQGPTDDNRIKPDIMAPGSAIISASGNSNNGATVQAGTSKSLSGTSMATPTIAGGSALMRQYFSEGFYPRGAKTAADVADPNGALMKAVLVNGTAILGAYPTNSFGWGRMFLENTLYFNSAIGGGAGDNRRMRYFERENDAGLNTGQMHEYTLNAVGAGEDFRVSLVWMDPEGAPGSAINRVNNLDLEVSGPGGTNLYRGNAFAAGVSSPNAGIADDRNNVEQIRIVAPAAGAYTLRVKATDVPGNGREGSDRQGYALVASGAFGVPDTAANAAPTAIAIASNNTSGVGIGFTGSSTQGYQLYRADGSCAAAPARAFRMVAHGAGSPLVDTTSQGGDTYAYRVRGASNDVEGDASSCVSGLSSDNCTRRPTFDTQAITRDFTNSSCSVALDWAAATSNCALNPGVNYLVERDTNPYFTAPTQIGNPTTDAFTDTAVTSGQPYYYRITARDGANNLSSPSTIVNATPVGPGGPSGVGYVDDVDDNTYMTMESPWRISNTRASTGSFSYHNAGDGQTYLANTCAAITSPPFVVPNGASLTYDARYNLEVNWDGVVVEISSDGGATWSDLPPDGGYPATLSATGSPPVNACGYAATHGAFTGSSLTLFQAKTTNLAAFANRAVMVRWRFTSDPGSEEEGFYLDNVRVNGTGPVPDPGRIFGSSFEELEGPTSCN
ncbi:MAG: S8 family serine peptidase, partial [Planctomycetota bacterium]